ncbi:hypothetical protein [Saccharothrix obliqua]|uniref:hypothetical protein n=1 Tax=Saccharothrix obliqua TaxID=2861747 RepID=UPI001C5CD02A|nr:hypothetical protein [Saccharothrix obliqua]MBW4720497.1 hypothetical protein [Saccharothrix obliqua]
MDVPRTADPVFVVVNGSAADDAALGWATEHARLTDAPLEVHRSGRDLFPAAVRAGVLVVGQVAGAPGGPPRLVRWLVERAPCDVVVVRGPAFAVRGGYHRVTALVTGARDDDVVLRRAARLAARRGARLRVLRAAPPLPVRADDPTWPLAHADEVLRGVPHTSVLARMHPHEAIARYADTDVLVTPEAGPVVRTALHHARCPVLVVRRTPVDVVDTPAALVGANA